MLNGAPGCFGSVLSYSATDKACISCSFANECGEKSYESLLEMREIMDVSEFEKQYNIERTKAGQYVRNESVQRTKRRVRRSNLTPEQELLVNDGTLPKKPRQLIGSIFRKGYDADYVRSAVRQGQNPFRGLKPQILDVAFEFLVGGTGVFAKKELHKTYMEMGMSLRTAHSQVSIVIAAFEILEIARSDIYENVKRLEGQC